MPDNESPHIALVAASCPGGAARHFRVQVASGETPSQWKLVGSFRDSGQAGHARREFKRPAKKHASWPIALCPRRRDRRLYRDGTPIAEAVTTAGCEAPSSWANARHPECRGFNFKATAVVCRAARTSPARICERAAHIARRPADSAGRRPEPARNRIFMPRQCPQGESFAVEYLGRRLPRRKRAGQRL